MRNVRIAGTGSYLPGDPISNEQLSNTFGIDEWIIENLGIRYRYWSVDISTRKLTKKGYEMAADASRKALNNANLDANEIDSIILVTAVPDYLMPNSAVMVQQELGIKECNTQELHAACAGSIQALENAYNTIKVGRAKNVLVCCFNLMSPTSIRELSQERKENISTLDLLNVCMFGDGASAVVLTESEDEGILYIANNSIGLNRRPGMRLLAGGSVYPFSKETIEKSLDKWQHDANAILEYGRELSRRALAEMLEKEHLEYKDIDHYIFPQANPSMLKEDIKELNAKGDFPTERIYMNVDRIGNTSTPGLFIALNELNTGKKLHNGELISIVGGEASKWIYGSILVKWMI